MGDPEELHLRVRQAIHDAPVADDASTMDVAAHTLDMVMASLMRKEAEAERLRRGLDSQGIIIAELEAILTTLKDMRERWNELVAERDDSKAEAERLQSERDQAVDILTKWQIATMGGLRQPIGERDCFLSNIEPPKPLDAKGGSDEGE